MKLCRKPRFCDVANALVGTVIHVDELLFPILWQCLCIHSISVVLRRNKTTIAAHELHRLIVGAMTIFQLIDGCTCSLSQ